MSGSSGNLNGWEVASLILEALALFVSPILIFIILIAYAVRLL